MKMNQSSRFKGYLSETEKSKFTITAGIIGASFLILQFILPFVFMLFMLPSMMFFQKDMFKIQNMGKSAVIKDQLWYEISSIGPRNDSSTPIIKKVSIDKQQEPEKVCELNVDSPWLMTDKSDLWYISSSAIGKIKNNKPEPFRNTKMLGDIYKPFFYQGKPAVIEKTPEGFFLVTFKDGNWQAGKKMSLTGSNEASKLNGVQVVIQNNNDVYIFARFDSIIYFQKGFTFEDEPKKQWKPVTPSSYKWDAASINGKLAVFYTDKGHHRGFNSTLNGVKLLDGKWTDFFKYQTPIMDKLIVHSLQGEKFIIVATSFPGSFYIIKAENNKVIEKIRHGNSFPFPKGMMAMMFIPHVFSFILPVILAIVLSSLMFKYRICYYTAEDKKEVAYASLTRRAMSQIIDSAFAGGPMIVGGIFMFHSFFDFEKLITSNSPFFMLSGFLFILAGAGWGFICLFLFSWWEGSCGQTPGKWCLGIKVLGTDLKPCGFGRAIVRNLLKFVDGFLQFMVGIMLIALTENWQRIGDMAARTIVIKKETSMM
jgi:uncharacterized RDD family membrane protein YckC